VLGADGGDELLCDILGAVRGAVVDDDDFPVEVAGELVSVRCFEFILSCFSVLCLEGLLEEPDNDG